MATRITLDGNILLDTPIGWDEASVKSLRDKNTRGLFLTYTTSLTFWGDGFDIINSALDESYCQELSILIENDDCDGIFSREFIGFLKLTDIDSFDPNKCTIECPLIDNGWNAKIANNIRQKAIVNVGESKNGVAITPVPVINVDLFNPTDPAGTFAFSREGYRYRECFEFIVSYITDGEVAFASDLLDFDAFRAIIFTGSAIIEDSTEAPDISFKDLFDNLNKIYNIGFAIELDGSGNPTLRVERSEFFKNNTSIIQLNKVQEVSMSLNKDELYSDVKVGSKEYSIDSSLSLPPFKLRGFRDEVYNFSGQCNEEKQLNLLNDFVIDSNEIEDALVNVNNDRLNNIFLINTRSPNEAVKNSTFSASVSEGTNDVLIASKLVDTTATFITDGVTTNDLVFNLTAGGQSVITSVDSEIQLTINFIFSSTLGDTYRIVSPPFTYNDEYANYNKINNWATDLPNALIKRLGTGSTDGFEADLTADIVVNTFPTTIQPIIYDNEISDPGGNYNNATGVYTSPVDGLIGLKASNTLNITGDLGVERIIASNATNNNGAKKFKPVIVLGDNNFLILNKGIVFYTMVTTLGSSYKISFSLKFPTDPLGVQGKSISGDISSAPTIIVRVITNKKTATFTFKNTSLSFQSFSFYLDVADDEQVGTMSFNNESINSLEVKDISLKALPKVSIQTGLRRFSSNGDILQTFSNTESLSAINENEILVGGFSFSEASFPVLTGDTIESFHTITLVDGLNVVVRVLGTGLFVTSSFETILLDDGGGDLVDILPENFNAYIYRLEKPITKEEFDDILNNQELSIDFNIDGQTNIKCIRESVERNVKTGIANFVLKSNQKVNPNGN